jgi:hypothetical protein
MKTQSSSTKGRKQGKKRKWYVTGCMCSDVIVYLLDKMEFQVDNLGDFIGWPFYCIVSDQRDRVLLRQVLQSGFTGLHSCWPNPTIKLFTSSHSSVGSHASSATRVASRVLVAFWTQPSLFEILCTCVPYSWNQNKKYIKKTAICEKAVFLLRKSCQPSVYCKLVLYVPSIKIKTA